MPKVAFKELPLIIMGGTTLIGGCLTLVLLPETLGMPLPETVRDIERLKQNEKGIFQCWSKKKLSEKVAEQQKQRSQHRHLDEH